MGADIRAHEELDILEALDFDVVCDVRVTTYVQLLGRRIFVDTQPPCGKPAVAVLVCVGCGVSVYACSAHLRWIRLLPLTFCHRCSREGPPADVFDVVPLPVPQGGAR